MPQLLEREDFTLLRHYLTDDVTSENCSSFLQKRRTCLTSIGLSSGLAGTVGNRTSGRRVGEAQAWQAPLWKALVEYTDKLGNRAGTAPISISALSKRWSRDDLPAGVTFARLYMRYFRVPPVYLQALQALGKHIEIHLCLPTPAVITGATLKIQLIWRTTDSPAPTQF